MDLAFIQDQLDTFETFGENIGKGLQTIPELLTTLVDFVRDFGDLSSTTEGNVENFSS